MCMPKFPRKRRRPDQTGSHSMCEARTHHEAGPESLSRPQDVATNRHPQSTRMYQQDITHTYTYTYIYIYIYIYMDLYEYISIYVYIHAHVHFVRSKGWDRYMYIKYIFGSILYHLFRIGAGSSRFCGWTAWLCDPWILSVSTWYYIWAPLPMRLSSCSHFKWQTSHCWLIIDQHKD